MKISAMEAAVKSETERRKAVWKRMMTAGEQALTDVIAYARSVGYNPLGGYGHLRAVVIVYYRQGSEPERQRRLGILLRGTIAHQHAVDQQAPYQYYPPLTDADPPAFRTAATEQLRAHIDKLRQAK